MDRALKADFFEQKALTVARELIGAELVVRQWDGVVMRYMITETEAYSGPNDKASHAYRGRTQRTQIMFGPPGYWYVYLCYGMHMMLNVVVDREEYPAAVLIRGIEGVEGPGRLTKALAIDRTFNGKKSERKSGLWIEKGNQKIPRHAITCTPRIGVNYAEEWKDKPYRFVLNLP